MTGFIRSTASAEVRETPNGTYVILKVHSWTATLTPAEARALLGRLSEAVRKLDRAEATARGERT